MMPCWTKPLLQRATYKRIRNATPFNGKHRNTEYDFDLTGLVERIQHLICFA